MIESTDTIFAHKLRHLRFSKNYKQDAMAKLLGLKSQQEYSNLENGKVNFTDEVITNICKAFEISEEEFVRPLETIHITDSPNTSTNSSNININDSQFVEALVKSKEETIESLKAQVALLKKLLKEKGWEF
jgi:transcriptional regulator with XRE-family HTH domain